MLPFQTGYLFSYGLAIAPPQVIGPVPGDVRLDFVFIGGEASGPCLQGQVKTGTDFATLHSDGVILVDVRGILESHMAR